MATQYLELMQRAALQAGAAILDVYSQPIQASLKADGSPVTRADGRAEAIILKHLKETGLPVLAEESVEAGEIPATGARFFVVDPLDGTKEFIKRNGQFTVNIALVENGVPSAGVVFVPVTGQLFSAGGNRALEFHVQGGQAGAGTEITTKGASPIKVLASRSHRTQELEEFCAALKKEQTLEVGSSLKFCLLARGDAQLYPRFSPTSQWDTAAGQAVLQSAGGVVLTLDERPLRYEGGTEGAQTADFLNPPFVAAANMEIAIKALKDMRKICQNRI